MKGTDRKKRRRRITAVLIAVLAVIAICCGYEAWSEYQVLHKASETYSLVADEYSDLTGEKVAGTVSEQATQVVESDLDMKVIDFDKLRKENRDIVAWLYCDDSVIDYPVVQGEDNDYYLHRLFTGETNALGTLFIDAANTPDFSDDNTIIYGHYMRNGQMFHTLGNYEDQDYYVDHPTMLLYTPDVTYQMQIFASSIMDGSQGFPLQFRTEEEKQEWIDSLFEVSDIRTGVQVTTEDRILTLYTCAYTYESARRLVFGKLVPLS